MTFVLDRLPAGRTRPLATGLLSFGITVAFILTRPGVALA